MKVYIHIGAPRTGTTSLQSLLSQNRGILSDLGIDYPAIALLHPTKGIAQHKLPFSLQSKWPEFAIKARTSRAETWGELRCHMQHASLPIFLSSETFSSLDESGVQFVAKFFQGHDVTVIYVYRDPEEWRRSMREQRIIWGFAEDDLPTSPAIDLSEEQTRHWRQHFKIDEIAYGPDTMRDVLAVAGVNIESLDPVDHRNTKAPDDVLQLLSRLNRIPMDERNRFQFNQAILEWRLRR